MTLTKIRRKAETAVGEEGEGRQREKRIGREEAEGTEEEEGGGGRQGKGRMRMPCLELESSTGLFAGSLALSLWEQSAGRLKTPPLKSVDPLHFPGILMQDTFTCTYYIKSA